MVATDSGGGGGGNNLPSKVLCISYPPLVHLDNDMIHNAMILLGEINRIRTFYDKNISLVEFRSTEEAQRAKEGLQGKLYNDPRITIDYSSNENDSSYPHKRTSDRGPVLDEHYGLGPFGSNVPSGPATVSQANNSDARISPGKHYSVHDYIWRGIIAKNGASVCRAVSVPIGESIRCELPDVVNCSARTGLDRLTKHYADAAVGFSIIFFLPDSDNDSALYEEFLRYLSSKDRAGVAKLGDGTHMFLVPPSDFIRKVLKVDGPPCLYGVVLKSAPSGTSFPPESYQPRYVDSPELTSSQIVQSRPLLTSDLIASLSNFQPSGRVEGNAGASAGIPASDITVAPESWRYVDR
ncbi:flowering time control protein FPA-like [Solanum dulcamara]|uniref:flowering time control protein FPA-like n=1 Tax=Solanum dulcamara TaxID=45834 RepID=UPI002486374D|nr:flowering time control protein FPA-like [Solanum dulcamara]